MELNKVDFLAQSIAKARDVMKKVEDKNFTPSPGGGQPLTEEQADSYADGNDNNVQYLSEEQVARMNRTVEMPQPISRNEPIIPMKNANTSRMPSAILQSFIENPIGDPSAPIGMDNMMNEIAKKVGGSKPQAPAAIPGQQRQPITENKKPTTQNTVAPAPTFDLQLMEYVIKKTVEETLAQVSKKTPISENIQIVIGGKTFSGKITSLNEVKKK